MSMTKPTQKESAPEQHLCARCHKRLPPNATFCAACGERVDEPQKPSTQLNDNIDINTRYRITSLVRRRPYISLFLAVDNQQRRTVAIRNLDISNLSKEAQDRVTEAVQYEYDLLRRNHIPYVLPLIDLRQAPNHLFVVAGWPIMARKNTGTGSPEDSLHTRLQTLEDLLQSGIGLPGEQVATSWIEHLSQAVAALHHQQIVIGELEPTTILVQEKDFSGQPALMASWLPPGTKELLSSKSVTVNTTPYRAPEALTDEPTILTDIYSLGAILYLLLTGVPPEQGPLYQRRKLRPPRDYNSHIRQGLDEIVMRALALDPTKRFQRAEDLMEALMLLHNRPATEIAPTQPSTSEVSTDSSLLLDDDYDMNSVTVRMRPLSQLEMQAKKAAPLAQAPTQDVQSQSPQETSPAPSNGNLSSREMLKHDMFAQAPEIDDEPQFEDKSRHLGQRLQKRITGILPAFPKPAQPKEEEQKDPGTQENQLSFLRRLQRMLLGEQRHALRAAALIEAPLRVLPNQGYAIRIQLMGRNKPRPVINPQKEPAGGLSSLVNEQVAYIEVRSDFHQSYTYIIQQAEVQIPDEGFAAEVIIPMKPFSKVSSGRRERLHIYFMDNKRNPLYEKPFALEVFVSHLVQPGREGHQALPIPY